MKDIVYRLSDSSTTTSRKNNSDNIRVDVTAVEVLICGFSYFTASQSQGTLVNFHYQSSIVHTVLVVFTGKKLNYVNVSH